MAALTKLEVAQLKKIQEDQTWDVIVRMLERRIGEINARTNETVADSAFEELRVLHKGQGAVEELKKFFDDLEKGAFE